MTVITIINVEIDINNNDNNYSYYYCHYHHDYHIFADLNYDKNSEYNRLSRRKTDDVKHALHNINSIPHCFTLQINLFIVYYESIMKL